MGSKADWIWTDGVHAKRNVWQCFRREFVLDFAPERGSLSVTADSRYVLFINGARIGQGPMKYFQAVVPYDTYDTAKHLRRGKNVISVLVHYMGISTMQHQYGDPGLWLSGECSGEGGFFSLVSDEAFRCAPCEAFGGSSPRISVQQGFTEHFDAALYEKFEDPAFIETAAWRGAKSVTRAGKLTARDIPMLTEETVHAQRVSRLRRVRPPSQSFVVDTRAMMTEPDGYQNCNPVSVQGLVACTVRTDRPEKVTLYLDIARKYPVFLSDRWYTPAEFGGHSKLYLEARLEAGDHLLIFDITAREHWMGVHFAIDSEAQLRILPPKGYEHLQQDASPFVLFGPFSPSVYNVNDTPGRGTNARHPDYRRALEQAGSVGLGGLEQYARAVPVSEVSFCDPMLLFANAREDDPAYYQDYSVPQEMHNLIIPDMSSAEIPCFPDADCEFTLDFGRELVGYLDFEIDAPAGTILDFYSYEYTAQGEIQHTWGLDPVLRYICREGRQHFVSFLRRGFRYCAAAVRGNVRPVRFYHLRAVESTYPLARTGSFSCSDRLLTDIWEISAHTVRQCSEDTFVDCPAYEQVFWVGDSRNESLISRYVYGKTENIRRCLELVPCSAPQSPLLCNHVPSGWDSVIPNWSFSWVIACAEHVEYTGDRAFLIRMIPYIRACLDAYLLHLNGERLLEIEAWNLLDWAEVDQPNAGVVTHQNMFMIASLERFALMLEEAGENAADYRAKAKQMRRAVNRRLWNPEKRAYYDCIHADGRYSEIYSIQTQICALLFDLPDSPSRLKAVQSLVKAPPEGYVLIRSPFMAFFYYEVLEKMGETGLMLSDMRRNFGNMIRHGATTCWEQYPESPLNKSYGGMLSRSHCHAWSAAPAYFLSRRVLGVCPGGRGWKSITIRPEPCGIEWARGAVPHPDGGSVWIEYEIKGSDMQLYISAPEGVELDIRVPKGLSCIPRIQRTAKIR